MDTSLFVYTQDRGLVKVIYNGVVSSRYICQKVSYNGVRSFISSFSDPLRNKYSSGLATTDRHYFQGHTRSSSDYRDIVQLDGSDEGQKPSSSPL